MTRGWRIGLTVLGAVIVVDLALYVLGTLTGGTPGGPDSSSYATGKTGAGAYAELLGRGGHTVERLRETPHAARLDPAHTVVLLDPPSVAQRDVVALQAFVAAGGRLVASAGSTPWLGRLLAEPPTGDTTGVTTAAAHGLAGVRTVQTSADNAWTKPGRAQPLVERGRRIVVAAAALGRGRVFLLADPSPLQNRLLGERDNAALGLALAGPRARDVDFLETYHGYGSSSGLAALPFAWKLLLGGAGLAALVYMIARGRRFGPPESVERDLPPSRFEYVEALGAVVARTKRRDEAVGPVRKHARDELLRRAALPPDAADDALRAAARRLGLSDEDADALIRPART
ncbi:MAG: hypothetical protein QOF27_163, partial [Gaiellaceae bacterium]|nr:hypothetical protein [Gaiellaceae bacterium]